MVFCSTVTHFLACNNLPQVQPFQLHALWHIFAGFGTYTLNLYWVLYRWDFLARRPELAGHWPLKFVLGRVDGLQEAGLAKVV